MRMARGCWWYYFSKFTEFMDTIFFVLRKKYDHISTLHVIHHGCMPMSVWFGVKFTPGGSLFVKGVEQAYPVLEKKITFFIEILGHDEKYIEKGFQTSMGFNKIKKF